MGESDGGWDPGRKMLESRTFPLSSLLSRIAEKAVTARGRLVEWGIRVPDDDRITQAIGLLREAAKSGQILPETAGVSPVLRAAWVAADFIDIAAFLPPERVKAVRQELTLACVGELWPKKGSRQPLQFQTQHWIAAILLHAGLEVDYARFSSKRRAKIPEFFVLNGAQRIAVEVKRPESERRVAASVIEANAKFADHNCWGAIVLELTDCVMPAKVEEFQNRAEALRTIAHQTIWDVERGTYHPDFRRVIYLGAVYRGAWAVAEEGATRLRLVGIALHYGYTGHPNSLQGHTSSWFQREFNRAYEGVVLRIDK